MLSDGAGRSRGLGVSGIGIDAKTLRGRKRSSGDGSLKMPSKRRSMRGGALGEVDEEQPGGELEDSLGELETRAAPRE